jgi:hypothetical protein
MVTSAIGTSARYFDFRAKRRLHGRDYFLDRSTAPIVTASGYLGKQSR